MASPSSLAAAVTSLSVTTPWVVQKFGGTSVGKFPEDIAEKIVKAYSHDGYRVAVVCSARSTNTKEEGTTTRLLQAADYAITSVRGNASSDETSLHDGSVHPDDVLDTAELEAVAKEAERQCTNKIEAIRESHLEVARLHIKSPELRKTLERDINKECDLIIGIMSAVRVLDEISPRTLDSIISAGEKLACLYMAALINDRGLKAQYIDLSHIVPSTYKSPNPANKNNTLDAEFYDYVKAHIKHEIERKCKKGEIPVITGYFGVVPGGLINGVGRGYTDFCAALAAVALKAEELQIWKEVDGIFTADPRKVPTARLLSIITPEEAAELTYYGSEVIHPFTMEQVINARIPIRIKNVINPTGSGTVIYPDNFTGTPGHATPPHPPKALERVPSSFFNVQQLHKGPTAVTTKNNILVLNIHSNHKDRSHGFLAHVFSILDQWKLVVDLISTSEVRVSMALHSNLPEKRLKQALNELRKYGTVDVTRKLCIVSLVGKNMKSSIGIAGQMFETLGRAGINIEMISQGASEINISTVIDQKDAIKALNVLHQTLLNRPVGRNTPSFVGVGDV
ncbi:uncharacterized protein SAPINGB_P002727 [Magnusiomyces paraingens]|uniref:aspartate kinase n=1 Tax=Magnusiomyces paraingens TaxID=2606893 RepID=A0A5E8BFG6_9ASCO|nr:uncharacterized protein SAPINGB_P002727 [Saprochaete ingens]VVT50366.1 unnamed protein product [Saprochaete ingens]